MMGGEPLCPENLFLTHMIIKAVKDALPDTKVYIWTGYLYEDLIKRKDGRTPQILELADVLIDGPYIQAERDITLPMRGSRNQRIINLHDANKFHLWRHDDCHSQLYLSSSRRNSRSLSLFYRTSNHS